MIVQGKEIDNGAMLEADIVILGAGAAGISIAQRLASTNLQILVVESGLAQYDVATQDLYAGKIAGVPFEPINITRLRMFGGTTNHWAGWCRPLEPEDFEPRPDWPESGWPISRADLDSYYEDAAKVCDLGAPAFEDFAHWQQASTKVQLERLALASDRLRTAIFQVASDNRQFNNLHGDVLRKSDNVRVILGATATELVPRSDAPQNNALDHVVVTTFDQTRFEVRGRAVVLALGAIETARLMLQSNRVIESGIGNQHDLVGRYFMDHPWAPLAGYLRFSQTGFNLPFYFETLKLAGSRVFGTISPDPSWARAEGVGGFRIVMRPSSKSTEGAEAVKSILADLRQGKVSEEFADHVRNIATDLDVITDNVYKTLTGSKTGLLHSSGGTDSYRGAFLDMNFEPQPNHESRVRLLDERDALGQPRVAVDWRLRESDLRTAERGMEAFAQEAGRLGLGRVRLSLERAAQGPWLEHMNGSRHHMGTTRMGESAERGVVDRNCKVFGMNNLFVASSSVFVTSGYANPTLTIVALSLRLADHLQDQLHKEMG